MELAGLTEDFRMMRYIFGERELLTETALPLSLYYKMVYEEEASFGKALVAGMADLKLPPDGLRKLDKV